MRVLKVSYAYPPFLEMGGPPVKVQAIAERLAQRGHAITVLTVNYGHPRRTQLRWIGNVEVVYLRATIRYRTVTVNPSVLSFGLKRLSQFDVVHIYGLYDLLGPVAALLCRYYGVPYVLEPLGMQRPIARSLRKKRLYHALLGGPLRRNASRVIATSELERRILLEEGLSPNRVTLRRNGIDLNQFSVLPNRGRFREKWNIRPEERLILFLGRLVSVKSPDLLLNAVSLLPVNKIRLAFAGPDEGDGYRQSLERVARGMNLNGNVLFTGPLYGQDKLEALVDADVFVLPSHSESFGNAAAEAMACGTPVIVSEGCGIAPYVKGQGGLVTAHDAGALRNTLERILTDSTLSARLKMQGPLVAQKLSWDQPVSAMETIYREILELRQAIHD